MKNFNSYRGNLITGGAEFLGPHLTEKLLKEGNDLLVADNLFAGKKRNLDHLLNNTHPDAMRHDVTFTLCLETKRIYNMDYQASPLQHH